MAAFGQHDLEGELLRMAVHGHSKVAQKVRTQQPIERLSRWKCIVDANIDIFTCEIADFQRPHSGKWQAMVCPQPVSRSMGGSRGTDTRKRSSSAGLRMVHAPPVSRRRRPAEHRSPWWRRHVIPDDPDPDRGLRRRRGRRRQTTWRNQRLGLLSRALLVTRHERFPIGLSC